MSEVIVQPEQGIMSQALTARSVLAQVNLVQEIMRGVMQDKEHYGTIPGCGTKKVLLKPGAEKLCFTFQLVPTFTVAERDLPNGHREYRITCRLSMRNGVTIAEGVGTCSTMEPKYRYRNSAVKCPECGKETVIKGKREFGGGWLCFAKKGGCGMKWEDGSKAIEDQAVGKSENPDPAEQYNTVLKMSKKRAHVDATITACAASDIFTQDIEELPENLEFVQMTKAEASAAAASPDPTNVPLHNEQARAEANRLWAQCKTLDKILANVIKRECGSDAEGAIIKFRAAIANLSKPTVGTADAADLDERESARLAEQAFAAAEKGEQ